MKFTLEKKALLMSEVDDARQVAKDRQWMLDPAVLQDAADVCLQKYYNTPDRYYGPRLVAVKEATICKNHYQIRPHVSLLVSYWHDGYKYAEISTDLVESYENRNGECYIVIFGETDDRVVK